jgi:hypothetical protein
MTQPNDSLPIGWYIDRNPDYNIFNNIRNITLPNYNDRNWLLNSLNFNNIQNIHNIHNIHNINHNNSPWIFDPHYNESNISNNYFYNINTFNTSRIIENRTALNSEEDFIHFENPPNHRINIDINSFTVSEEDKTCCICMEERETEEFCRLNCQHTFCVQCINQHLHTNYSCPICRSDITDLSVQNNYIREKINF